MYPASQVISLRNVLLQVEHLTGILGKFRHQGFAHKPTRPDTRLLLAALIGYGENIGIRKMALISKSISVNALERVATQYFSPEMTLEAAVRSRWGIIRHWAGKRTGSDRLLRVAK